MFRKLIVCAFVLLCFAGVATAAPIHDAAAKGDLAKVQGLVAAKPSLVNAKDADGATPLHYAAAAGRDTVASFLIEKGAKVNAVKKDGVTPLHVAAATGQKGILQILLKAGAKQDVVDKKGRTPAALAIERNHQDLLPLLTPPPPKNGNPNANNPNRPKANGNPFAAQNGAPPVPFPGAETKPGINFVKLADETVDLLGKGDYAGVHSRFDDRMKKVLPPDKIGLAWSTVVAKDGAFVKRTSSRRAKEQGYETVYVNVQFQRASYDAKLAFDDRGQIAGFWIQPPTAQPGQGQPGRAFPGTDGRSQRGNRGQH